ncbi:MAG: DeoR/GlpR family DNA-binding transcription regulator [Clostridium sp.]
MLPEERKQNILKIIQAEKKVYVTNLSNLYNVTDETIRKDLDKLEQDGLLTRTYGGALLNKIQTRQDISYLKRSKVNIEAKKTIASKLMPYIKDGFTIMADSSSTVLETLKFCEESGKKNLTVVTNSIEVVNTLADSSINIILTGGTFSYNTMSLIGSLSEYTINKYTVDLALISCRGFDIDKGFTDSNESEVIIKKAMLKQANKTFLLIDSSKLRKIAFINLLESNKLDYVVSEKVLDLDFIEFLHDNDMEFI